MSAGIAQYLFICLPCFCSASTLLLLCCFAGRLIHAILSGPAPGSLAQLSHHRSLRGPCSHLIALRLCHAREEERRRESARKGELRETVMIETKTYAKRHEAGEEIYQMSLDHRRLKLRWGLRGQDLRIQNLVFNSTEAARQAYFSKVDGLEAGGYLDATEGGAS